MKKHYTLIIVALFAMFGLNANAAMWLVGDAFNGWNESGNVQMTQNGDIYSYTATLNVGKYFAFFKDSQSWSSQRGPETGNAAPTGNWESTKSGGAWKVAATGEYLLEYNYSTDEARIAIVQQQPFDATQRKFAVTGAAFGGWSMPPTAAQTFTNNGDGTYTLVYEGATAGQFKLSGISINDDFASSWDVFNSGCYHNSGLTIGDNALSTGNTGNMNFPISGDVTLTISNVTESSCTLNISATQVVVPDKAYYLVGGFNSWSTSSHPFTEVSDGVFQIVQTFNGQFKIVDENGSWLGGSKILTAEDNTIDVTGDTGGNMTLETESEYTLTIQNGTLTVTGFPSVTPPAEPYATVYIDKQSAPGNVYFWDSTSDYGSWPGTAISNLGENAAGTYYVVEYTHENANEPKLIFNDSQGQTANISVADGDILKYLGNNVYVLNGVTYPSLTGVHLVGAVGAGEWVNQGELILNNGAYVLADKKVKSGFKFKIVASYNSGDNVWYGAQSNGDFLVNADILGNAITMGDSNDFKDLYFEKGGTFTFTFVMGSAPTLTISGAFNPDFKTFAGVVKNANDQPLEGVTVTAVPAPVPNASGIRLLAEDDYTTVTGADGAFSLEVPYEADYNVSFSKYGYMDLTLNEDQLQEEIILSYNPATGIDVLTAGKTVSAVKYVNVSGMTSDKPFDGLNIVVITYEDGSRQTSKLIK